MSSPNRLIAVLLLLFGCESQCPCSATSPNVKQEQELLQLKQRINEKDSVWSEVELGRWYAKNHDRQSAIECYKKADLLATKPDAALLDLVFAWEELLTQVPLDPQCHFGLGSALEKQGWHLEQAKAHYQRALELLPSGQHDCSLESALSRLPELERIEKKNQLAECGPTESSYKNI